jgi:hypothetical protein
VHTVLSASLIPDTLHPFSPIHPSIASLFTPYNLTIISASLLTLAAGRARGEKERQDGMETLRRAVWEEHAASLADIEEARAIGRCLG